MDIQGERGFVNFLNPFKASVLSEAKKKSNLKWKYTVSWIRPLAFQLNALDHLALTFVEVYLKTKILTLS